MDSRGSLSASGFGPGGPYPSGFGPGGPNQGGSKSARTPAIEDQKHPRHQAELDFASPVAVLISLSRNS